MEKDIYCLHTYTSNDILQSKKYREKLAKLKQAIFERDYSPYGHINVAFYAAVTEELYNSLHDNLKKLHFTTHNKYKKLAINQKENGTPFADVLDTNEFNKELFEKFKIINRDIKDREISPEKLKHLKHLLMQQYYMLPKEYKSKIYIASNYNGLSYDEKVLLNVDLDLFKDDSSREFFNSLKTK